jgi:hypothetical protein
MAFLKKSLTLFAIWSPLKSAAQGKRKFKGGYEMKMAVAENRKLDNTIVE